MSGLGSRHQVAYFNLLPRYRLWDSALPPFLLADSSAVTLAVIFEASTL